MKWTSDQMLRRLLPQDHLPELADPSGHIVIAEVATDPAWIGSSLQRIGTATRSRVAYFTRLGEVCRPGDNPAGGDLIHLPSFRDPVGGRGTDAR